MRTDLRCKNGMSLLVDAARLDDVFVGYSAARRRHRGSHARRRCSMHPNLTRAAALVGLWVVCAAGNAVRLKFGSF